MKKDKKAYIAHVVLYTAMYAKEVATSNNL